VTAGAAATAAAGATAIRVARRVNLVAWVRSRRNSASILIVSAKFFLCSAGSERSRAKRSNAALGTIWHVQHIHVLLGALSNVDTPKTKRGRMQPVVARGRVTADCARRVMRGGSWQFALWHLRSAARGAVPRPIFASWVCGSPDHCNNPSVH